MLQFWPPSINPLLMIEWRLKAHPIWHKCWKNPLWIVTLSCKEGLISLRPECSWRARRYTIVLEESVQYRYLHFTPPPAKHAFHLLSDRWRTVLGKSQQVLFSVVLFWTLIGMQNLWHPIWTHVNRAELLEFPAHCCSNSSETCLIHEKCWPRNEYCHCLQIQFWSQFHIFFQLPTRAQSWCSLGSILLVVMLNLLSEGCVHDKPLYWIVCEISSVFRHEVLSNFNNIQKSCVHTKMCSICLVVTAFHFVLHIAAIEDLCWPVHHNPQVLLPWSHWARVRNLIALRQRVAPFLSWKDSYRVFRLIGGVYTIIGAFCQKTQARATLPIGWRLKSGPNCSEKQKSAFLWPRLQREAKKVHVQSPLSPKRSLFGTSFYAWQHGLWQVPDQGVNSEVMSFLWSLHPSFVLRAFSCNSQSFLWDFTVSGIWRAPFHIWRLMAPISVYHGVVQADFACLGGVRWNKNWGTPQLKKSLKNSYKIVSCLAHQKLWKGGFLAQHPQSGETGPNRAKQMRVTIKISDRSTKHDPNQGKQGNPNS